MAFETLTIDQHTKAEFQYEEHTIYIEEMFDNLIEIEYPPEINVIGYQALSANNELMDCRKYSDFPVFGLDKDVENQLKEMISVLRIASKISNKEGCKVEIEKITESQFSYISSLVGFADYRNQKKGKSWNELLGLIIDYLDKYADILSPQFQHLTIYFPDNYSKVWLYIEKDTQTISRDIIAVCEESSYGEYQTYINAHTHKVGIIDSNSDIIIPADYEYLEQVGDLFFIQESDRYNKRTYYLNVQEKKLEKLPDNIQFCFYLDNGLAVFKDEENYRGVLLNEGTLVIPYKYDVIWLNGNLLIAEGSKRGRNFFEFYQLDGQKINLPQIKRIYRGEEDPYMILCTTDKKYGMIDNNGVLKIPFEYEGLDFLSDNLLRYISEESENLYGIIDTEGNIITPPVFNWIDDFCEGLAKVRILKEGKRLWGFIDEKGVIVIEPQFPSANSFNNGYALVYIDDEFVLIDKKGKITFHFPQDSWVDLYRDEEGVYFYENREGMRFNYKGEQIHN